MKSAGSDLDRYREIGQRIKIARNRRGISQAELGRRIGFKSACALLYIEQGKTLLKVFDLVAIARELNVSMASLIFEKSEQMHMSPEWITTSTDDLRG